uniref:Uncharacterized protein n=1 Tax=Acrobeloides nanus TaxID=290746 RepID=A0A914CZC4_9BILA
MSRWDTGTVGTPPPSLNNPNPSFQGALLPSSDSSMSNLVALDAADAYQRGSIGDFVGSSLEGAQSGFVRCIYQAKYVRNHTVTLLCEKNAGCCQDGCCPKDQFWMAGVFVLLAFVLLVFIVGACLMIICYQRSKIKQRREEKEAYEYGVGSQVNGYPPMGYPPYSTVEGPRY